MYDNNKLGIAAERLPREVVLEYTWQEQVLLNEDPEKDLNFGKWNGTNFNLECGGTLVFDDRGNLLSWFRKPGIEHITAAAEQVILERKHAWEQDPVQARADKYKKPTKHEIDQLADLEEGRKRRAAIKSYLSHLIRRGLVGEPQPENRFQDGSSPVAAVEVGGSVRFEATPYLRKNDFDAEEEEEWPANY